MTTPKPPHIILLLDDQHRWDALGCVNSQVKTPALDALARDGTRFSEATCQAPMCVPSRYSLMTGLYPFQTTVRTNSDSLPDERLPPTLAQRLHAAGYQTAGFGKTHWNAPGCSTRGFETRAIGQPAGSSLHERGATMMGEHDPQGLAAYFAETDAYGPGEEEVPGYVGCTSSVPEAQHRDGWVAERCLEFLDGGLDAARPLFLYLSFLKPHAGFNVPPGFEDLYDIDSVPDMPQPPWDRDDPRHTGKTDHRAEFFRNASPELRRRTVLRYWANCSWIDSLFARVIARLQDKGIWDDAIVLHASDHGEMLGERWWRFTKYNLYEPSVRVPMILSGPRLPASLRGTVDARPAELVDIVPTLLDAAGIEPPAALPGGSLLRAPVRLGTTSECCEGPAPYARQSLMWRRDGWKLILCNPRRGRDRLLSVDDAEGELYDLAADPREYANLYNEPAHRDRREAMTRELLLHLAAAGAGGG